jgi:hypothetical protein
MFLFYGREHPILRSIRQFGEVAIVDEWQARGHHAKLDNRGKPALYLGHAKDHAQDVYRFLNLATNRVIMSRDVTWLNKTYATYKDIDGVVITDDDDEPVETVATGTNEAIIVPQPQVPFFGVQPHDVETVDDPYPPVPDTPPAPIAPRLASELRRIDANLGDVDTSQGRNLRSGREIGGIQDISELCFHTVVQRSSVVPDFALKTENVDPAKLNPSSYKDHFVVPSKVNDAWNHPDEFQRKHWHEAIRLELAKMANYNVWHMVKRAVIPQGRKCVKCKWVFDIKRNGVFRA